MKILFLDVDGVLNSYQSQTYLPLSKPALKRLKTIVEETGCKIVLSSTWRKLESTKRRLSTRLAYRGLYITSQTPVLKGFRGEEIKQWLDNHSNISSYCILDDDADMYPEQFPFFVRTNPEVGLTDENVKEVIKILNK